MLRYLRLPARIFWLLPWPWKFVVVGVVILLLTAIPSVIDTIDRYASSPAEPVVRSEPSPSHSPQGERADLRVTTTPKQTLTPEELWGSQQIGDTFPYRHWQLSVLWWRESEIVIATKSDVRIDEGDRVWHAFPAEPGRKFVLVAYTVRLANDATEPMLYGPGGHWVQGKLIATNGREWQPKPMSRSYALGPDSYNNSYSDWRLATEAEKHALPYRTINKELFPGEGIEEVEAIWFEVVESDVPSKLKLNVKGTPIEIFDDEVPTIHLTPETALPPVPW